DPLVPAGGLLRLQVPVTAQAQLGLRADDHAGLARRVRVVACQAIAALEGRVVGSAHGLLHEVAVTARAQRRSRLLEELRLLGPMRVVAGDAVPVLHGRVDGALLE